MRWFQPTVPRLVTILMTTLLGCHRADVISAPAAPDAGRDDNRASEQQGSVLDAEAEFARLRQNMVVEQISARGIRDLSVLEAVGKVPRHRFVPQRDRDRSYDDGPLPIGHSQTISQPYIVALMTELVQPQSDDRALEIGTGCGYQAAVLGELVKEVYSIEIVQPLADEARQRLQDLGYANIHVRCGDGYQGWPEHAPFQVILVTAAPDHIPQPLVEQLAPGGRMVIPVGRYSQELLLLEKQPDGKIRESRIAPVAFVPMTGEAQRR
jgi:protein-L-isoaspartate(D-aspartate) O-methyltransferase